MNTLGKDRRALSAVDLFAGCGGMSLGFMNAGFDVVRAYDNWDAAINVYKNNFNHPIIKMNLTNEKNAIKSILEVLPDLIFGGPPCQDFSTAGYQDETRGRAVLSISFANIVASVHPRWFVMENVATIRNTQSFKKAYSIFKDAGYGFSMLHIAVSLKLGSACSLLVGWTKVMIFFLMD